MKRILLLTFGLVSGLYAQAQATIADARALGVGQTVTIKGVVTNGSELGNIRYLQDATGGLAAFSATLSSVQRYDSITVTGTLLEFSGLLELSPVSSLQIMVLQLLFLHPCNYQFYQLLRFMSQS